MNNRVIKRCILSCIVCVCPLLAFVHSVYFVYFSDLTER
jgi:hypothetical protein